MLTISETTDDDFSLIPNGSIWTAENLSSDIEIKDVKYRILSIVEQSLNEYQLTGLIYNETKFASIDKRKRIAKTQFSKPQIMTPRAKPSALSSTQGASVESLIAFDASHMKENGGFGFEDAEAGVSLKVNFGNVVDDSGVNRDDIGGYSVKVTRSGKSITFTLDADKTEFIAHLGDRDNIQYVNYRISVVDKNGIHEEIGLPI